LYLFLLDGGYGQNDNAANISLFKSSIDFDFESSVTTGTIKPVSLEAITSSLGSSFFISFFISFLSGTIIDRNIDFYGDLSLLSLLL